MQLIKFNQYQIMPWKNGGGETREVALGYNKISVKKSPDWRVSIATIAQSGPFSSFIDMDRTIILLNGDDVVLTLNGQDEVKLTQEGECYSFQGEEKVYATVTGAPSTDLNIMTNRHYYRHHMQRLDKPLPIFDASKIIKIFLVALSSLDLSLGNDKIAMDALDSLIFDGSDILHDIPQNKQLIIMIVMNKA